MNPFEKNKAEGRMRKAALAAALSGMMLPALTVMATSDIYPNNVAVNVTIPTGIMPVIDTTNFVNNNSFHITFTAPAPGGNAEMFESENTINYTNKKVMTINSSYLTNTFGVQLTVNSGCGFQFDHYSTSTHVPSMAKTFYNSSQIRANSLVDILANATFLSTKGVCTVTATNIVNPGTIQLGLNGLMQITGRDVDLTRGGLVVEGFGTSFPSVAAVTVLTALVGRETNEIFPPVNFSLPNPFSPLLRLTNATGYYEGNLPIGQNTTLTRAVFIANPVPSVTNNVYFDSGVSAVLGSFNDIFVEWVGTYVEPVTGDIKANYFYLDDDFGEVTNLQLIPGTPAAPALVPFNYTWISGGPLALGPASLPTTSLPFPASLITNGFSYESVKFISTTEPPGVTAINPSGALTNLDGRIQINASRTLDLTQAQISGLNYMLLSCTNQFNGAAGAQISAPFADISLGVTNGFMSISNVLEPTVPNWVGPCQVFSARWFDVITNFSGTFTNIYHVLLVNSTAANTTPPQVQNLTLHGTNLFISDVLNTFGTVSIDAQNLTLTTNMDTPAAPDGELNIQNPAMVWSTALPNLRNVTNSGAISIFNLIDAGSAALPYNAFINHGRVFDQGSIIYASNFESDGIISNGVSGSFILQSQNATLTNGIMFAGGDVSITTGSLLTSNLFLRANYSLTLTVTNQLTDTGPTNGSIWVVGTNGTTGDGGISLLRLPTSGDLLGTTITNYAPAGQNIVNTWAGTNYGVSTWGYTNNAAIGRLILDAIHGGSPVFTFQGVGASNAIYVDYLELRDDATIRDQGGSGTNFVALNFPDNLVIYYAQAVVGGVSAAKKINGWNSGHLRWVPQYAGYFSSTNMVYPGNVTNAINAALVQDAPPLDSDGDGIINSSDPTPLFIVPTSEDLQMIPTNGNTKMLFIWHSIPSATNKLSYSPDMINWFVATNFVSPATVPPVGGWPITNSVVTPYNGVNIYHMEPIVRPNTTSVYGPGF